MQHDGPIPCFSARMARRQPLNATWAAGCRAAEDNFATWADLTRHIDLVSMHLADGRRELQMRGELSAAAALVRLLGMCLATVPTVSQSLKGGPGQHWLALVQGDAGRGMLAGVLEMPDLLLGLASPRGASTRSEGMARRASHLAPVPSDSF